MFFLAAHNILMLSYSQSSRDRWDYMLTDGLNRRTTKTNFQAPPPT